MLPTRFLILLYKCHAPSVINFQSIFSGSASELRRMEPRAPGVSASELGRREPEVPWPPPRYAARFPDALDPSAAHTLLLRALVSVSPQSTREGDALFRQILNAKPTEHTSRRALLFRVP